MKPCLYTRRDLARDLRALHALRVADKEQLRTWYQEARRVQDALHDREATEPVSPEDFHFLMHYLIDADIRLKDAEYARVQSERLLTFIAALES